MVNTVDKLLNNVGDDLNGVWNNVLQKIKSVFYNTDTKIFSNSSYPEYYKYKKTNEDGTQTYLIYNGELKDYTTYQITEEGEIDSRQSNSMHIPDEKTMIILLYDKIKYSLLPKVIIDREKQEPKILSSNLAFGKSIKKVASKVKSKVKTGAKQYAASTPQGQAITAGQSAMKKQKSKGRKSVIPKPGKKGGTGGMFSNLFSNLTETKIYGIPVLYAGLGTMFIGLPLLKKMGRKR